MMPKKDEVPDKKQDRMAASENAMTQPANSAHDRFSPKWMPYYRIAESLNERGIRSKRGLKWYPATVSYLVKNVITKLSLA